MNAKFDEINKVYNVVQDQFERSLFENPNSLEQLEIEMLRKRFSYFNMQKVQKTPPGLLAICAIIEYFIFN
ncbi:unnamed protein product [Meloidogyne enterolobii]